MSRLSLSATAGADSDGGFRQRIGEVLLRVALRVLNVSDLQAFNWYPDGYTGESGKQRVVISSRRVDYWKSYDYADGVPVYLVVTDDGAVLGGFLWWKDARQAAKTLSQHYDDYHFGEHVLDEETNRVVDSMHAVDELEANLSVEKVWVNREFDWSEWDESDRVINGDSVRTLAELKEQIDT